MYGERSGREWQGGQTYPRYRSAGSIYGTPSGNDVTWQLPAVPRVDEAVPRRRRSENGRSPNGRSPNGKPSKDRTQSRRKQMPLWQEMPLLLIVAFCLAVLIRTFLLQAFFIPSGSMEDTLLVGDRVLVNKVVYDMRDPLRGEVVVFRGTAAWVPENLSEPSPGFLVKLGRTVGDLVGVSRPGEKDFIKRVIGLPGDRVKCCDKVGRVLVNNRPLDEPYVLENSPLDAPPNSRECRSRRFEEVLVQPGNMFVMGDHRLVSQDSRCQGQVPIENVIGRAFVIVWPSKRWDTLPVPSTFDNLPVAYAGGAPVVRADLTAPGGPPDIGTFGIIMPILLTSLLPARSRRNFPGRRRRLAA